MSDAAVQAAPQGLQSLVKTKRVLVTVGAGGVGKTTTAATLGLLAARLGRRTLVMTIDPARRLATSLGLGALDHQERVVPDEKMVAAGLPTGLLSAMMLDQKHTFDDLILRYAADPAAARRVLDNRIYRELSTRLAGGQEYAAMEKLYELSETGRYDLLVLDTPPTANALDFLDAPRKMIDLVESPAVSLLVSSYRRAGRMSFKLLSLGASYVFKRIARFIGGDFLDDIAGFFSDVHELLEGFRDRAAKVIQLMERPDVGFVLVASPDPRAIDEAEALYGRLKNSGMSPEAFVINRVHPLAPIRATVEEVAARCAARGLPPEVAARLASELVECHRRLQVLAAADDEEIRRLLRGTGARAPCIRVPFFNEDVHDVAGLMRLSEHLI